MIATLKMFFCFILALTSLIIAVIAGTFGMGYFLVLGDGDWMTYIETYRQSFSVIAAAQVIVSLTVAGLGVMYFLMKMADIGRREDQRRQRNREYRNRTDSQILNDTIANKTTGTRLN